MSSMDNKESFLLGVFLASVIWFLGGLCSAQYLWSQACVTHGAASYDTKTGAWHWNDDPEYKETP